MTFQRARSEEQREARRQAILRAAAAMLAEMPVADISLNELSRRTGLAKSNVLRYFESREAVLLELLDAAWRDWLARLALALDLNLNLALDLDLDLDEIVSPAAPARERGDRVADVLAGSLAAEPALCDLLNAQAAVLERNISPEVAARYKRAALANVAALGRLLLPPLPELSEPDSFRLAGAVIMVAGAVWPHSQPSAAMLAAYAADPELATMRLNFTTTLREAIEVLISGFLSRRSARLLHRGLEEPLTRGAPVAVLVRVTRAGEG
jgi:AcrR family transcriptional regulator